MLDILAEPQDFGGRKDNEKRNDDEPSDDECNEFEWKQHWFDDGLYVCVVKCFVLMKKIELIISDWWKHLVSYGFFFDELENCSSLTIPERTLLLSLFFWEKNHKVHTDNETNEELKNNEYKKE